ncbi:MAG: S41 family peptidase [Pseudomonadota bacterium]
MRKKLILCFSIAAILYVFCSDGISLRLSARTQEAYDHLKTFSDVLTIVQNNYVDEIDLKKIIYNAIKGMVASLDPHSSFMPPDLYKELQVETKGSFGGLGIEITMKDDILTVVAPIEDTPAYHAGIKTGDKIIKIENESTKNMGLVDAVKKMRGKPGSPIKITILRDDLKEPRDFSIVRDIIKIKSVKFKMLEDKFGYIRITQFQENTENEFKKAIKSLRSEKAPLQGLVLDLRGNPGGLLDQAVKISDEFLDSGLIVYTEGRVESQRMQFHAKKDDDTVEYPTVALVNGGSASASEIVAGALQDHGKAIIVGTQTFGKGTVQTIYPLSDGSGLRITTAKYYTPGHRSIQEKGITPDITVEDNIDGTSGKKIKFLREKDLINHFKGQSPEEKINQETKEQAKEQTKEKEPEENATVKKDENETADPPLQTAITILKSWELFKKATGKTVQESSP